LRLIQKTSAQYTLAVMHANGQGVDQDEAQAIQYYSMAADQGHAAAQFDLGSMYANGQGVAADDFAAMRFYRLAAI
jgi:TPR repeat protein